MRFCPPKPLIAALGLLLGLSISGNTHAVEPVALGGNTSLFRDASWDWNLLALHQQRREHLAGLTDTLGAGACILDLDSDGWMDVLLVGGSGQRRDHGAATWWQTPRGHRLFRNDHGQGFTDVTADSGLEASWGMGCATGDLDGDGDEDLLISAYQALQFYENTGNGRFRPVTDTGIGGAGWGTSVTLADFDGDGRLDIYLTRFIDYQRGQRTFEAGSGFQPGVPVDFQAQLYDPLPNRFLHNQGDWRFTDIAANNGTANPEGRGLQALWWPPTETLLVLNGANSPLAAYRLGNDGGSSNALPEWRTSLAGGVYGGTFLSGSRVLLSTAPGDAPGLLVQGQDLPNAWDMGLATDTGLALQGWGLVSADFNNDGHLDVLTAHGRATPDTDAPNVPQGQPDTLHLGGKGGRFQFTEQGSRFASSRAALAFDANNDGALDALVTRNNDTPLLLLNRGAQPGHWLGLRLRDRESNILGHGVQVQLKVGDSTLETGHYRRPGFLSQGDPRLHIGLGEIDTIEQLEVLWPDGSRSTHPGPAVDHYWDIQQGSADALAYKTDSPGAQAKVSKHRLYWRQFGDTYVRLLVRGDGGGGFLREVTRDDPKALSAALGALPPRPAPQWFYLLERALVAADDSTRATAVAVLQDWELEESVLRLLPLLADESPAIRCRTAQLFQHWFVEEEAVIHRKQLALTPLVRMLDAPDDRSRICAMGALAEAERFRGFHRLAELTTDDNPSVAVAAVQTLGRIRQREAIPVLQALAEAESTTADMQHAIERALVPLAATGGPGRADPAYTAARDAASSIPANKVAAPGPAVQALLILYQARGSTAERQLLQQLGELDSAVTWRGLLERLPPDLQRTQRVLMKGVFHRDVEVQRIAIAFSDPLMADPKLAATLWRRVVSSGLERSVRLALMDKLGEHDAHRLLGMLDTIGPRL